MNTENLFKIIVESVDELLKQNEDIINITLKDELKINFTTKISLSDKKLKTTMSFNIGKVKEDIELNIE